MPCIHFTQKAAYTVEDLVEIMALLRAPGGCPWDREQTHLSIKANLIEEAYEGVEAIERGDADMLCEELGDILLQVVFHSEIAREAGGFDFDAVADGICKKLILRHPHIFGDVVVRDSAQVLDNWDAIKRVEKHQSTTTETLRAVPRVFPALMRSAKVQRRAAKGGFDYPDAGWAMDDLRSELDELTAALLGSDPAAIEEELGDLLFSCVNVARFSQVDPEQALTQACEKFIARFERVEGLAARQGSDLHALSTEALLALWKRAKQQD